MLILYCILWVFSLYMVLLLACTQSHAHNYIFESHNLSMFEFLVRNFPKISFTEHIARSILPSLP